MSQTKRNKITTEPSQLACGSVVFSTKTKFGEGVLLEEVLGEDVGNLSIPSQSKKYQKILHWKQFILVPKVPKKSLPNLIVSDSAGKVQQTNYGIWLKMQKLIKVSFIDGRWQTN